MSPVKRKTASKRKKGPKAAKRAKSISGDRWEEVSRRIPLGERLPSNPEIVTEDEPDVIENFQPSEEDGA